MSATQITQKRSKTQAKSEIERMIEQKTLKQKFCVRNIAKRLRNWLEAYIHLNPRQQVTKQTEPPIIYILKQKHIKKHEKSQI